MSIIKRSGVIALIVGCCFLSACENSNDDYPMLGGGTVNFDQLKGKVVMLVYWADWCSTSNQAMPDFNAFATLRKNDVVVLGVDIDLELDDDTAEKVASSGIDFPILLKDPRERFGVEPSQVLPEILIIGRDGRFQQMLIGAQTAENLELIVSKLEDEITYSE